MTFECIFLSMILLVMAIWIFIGLSLYFLPLIIAYIRRHNNTLAIAILTLFTGWTFLGWLAAILWSLNSDVKDRENDD